VKVYRVSETIWHSSSIFISTH